MDTSAFPPTELVTKENQTVRLMAKQKLPAAVAPSAQPLQISVPAANVVPLKEVLGQIFCAFIQLSLVVWATDEKTGIKLKNKKPRKFENLCIPIYIKGLKLANYFIINPFVVMKSCFFYVDKRLGMTILITYF